MFDGRTPQIDPDGLRVACGKTPGVPQGFFLLLVPQTQECRHGQCLRSHSRVDPSGVATTESAVAASHAVGSVPMQRLSESED